MKTTKEKITHYTTEDEQVEAMVNGQSDAIFETCRRKAMQEALDRAYKRLNESYSDQQYVWDANKVKQWGRKPASEAQLRVIRRRLPKFDAENLTKGEASQIMNRLCYGSAKCRRPE